MVMNFLEKEREEKRREIKAKVREWSSKQGIEESE